MVNVDALNCKDISSTNAQISLHRPIVPADASATIGTEEHPMVVHGSITSAESSQSLTPLRTLYRAGLNNKYLYFNIPWESTDYIVNMTMQHGSSDPVICTVDDAAVNNTHFYPRFYKLDGSAWTLNSLPAYYVLYVTVYSPTGQLIATGASFPCG